MTRMTYLSAEALHHDITAKEYYYISLHFDLIFQHIFNENDGQQTR